MIRSWLAAKKELMVRKAEDVVGKDLVQAADLVVAE
jgi:hypothetical protein